MVAMPASNSLHSRSPRTESRPRRASSARAVLAQPEIHPIRLRRLRRHDLKLTHRLLHKRADPRLSGGIQFLQREGGRPHGAFVEVRLVAEAERRVPRLELLRALEEAYDLAVLGIGGHPVPGS